MSSGSKHTAKASIEITLTKESRSPCQVPPIICEKIIFLFNKVKVYYLKAF